MTEICYQNMPYSYLFFLNHLIHKTQGAVPYYDTAPSLQVKNTYYLVTILILPPVLNRSCDTK
jgi:hypothetical protein